jgi:peptidoglycan/LPS O-acetylase OafA/YrhL
VKYRADIDGLRAVAVLPVVMFHAGIPPFSGGYVGVDIFFVISGFLITTIIADEISSDRFSVARFYERRIRRILPAFAVMVISTTLIATWLMLPKDLEMFGRSVWSSALFSSNISFWVESSDYFGVSSDLKPLLHTWSLSVEEQFYILFPLTLIAVHRFGAWRYASAICAAGFAVSLILSIYGVRYASMASYYLLPARAWELLMGSLLAFRVLPAPRHRLQAEIEALAGLALIFISVFTYRPDTSFPGLMAIPPVLGAALIIHAGMAGSPSSALRLLGVAPVRFVGVISYSLYLWHWPIIVFATYYYIELTGGLKLSILCLSIVAATLSWRFVEQPFRKAGGVLPRRALFNASACALAALVAGGSYLALSAGLPSRVPPEIQIMAEKRTYFGPGRECGGAYAKRRTAESLCTLGSAGIAPDFLLIGDSHADALAASVFEAASAVRRSGYQLTDTGYRPLIGYRKLGEEAKYSYLTALATGLLANAKGIRDVIVPIYWEQATLKDRYLDADNEVKSGIEGVENGLAALVTRYPDKRFLLVLPAGNSPAFGGAPAARAAWYGRDFDPIVPIDAFRQTRSRYQGVIAILSGLPNVVLIDLSTKLCDATACRGMVAGKPAFSDDNHVAYLASQLFREDFQTFLKPPSISPGS